MHHDLVQQFNRTLALIISPITPHTSEHIWKAILKEPDSIQNALWPDPPASYQASPDLLAAGAYMRNTIKTIRDAELLLAKKKAKKGSAGGPAAYDPAGTKRSVNIFVAANFPPWQDQCMEIMERTYDADKGAVDDAKIKEELTKLGILKDKRVMPFIQMQKVCVGAFACSTMLTDNRVETNGTNRSGSNVPPTASILRS